VGLTVRVSYRNSDGTTWVRQGEAQAPLAQHSTEWPSGGLTWSVRPGGLIASEDAQAQYRESQTSLRQGLPGGDAAAPVGSALTAASESRIRFLAPSLAIAWAGGVTTSVQYARNRTDLTTAGNVTRNDRVDWSGSLAFGFRAPRSLVRLPNPVRTQMAATASDTRVCLIRAGTQDCTSVADSRRRQFDVKLDTGVSPTVVGGASFNYILTDQRHLSSRVQQYVFTIFAEINFVAGRSQ
jgi:hypothetical protein